MDLALRSVADAEAIDVSDDDLEAEYQRIAVRVNQKPNQVRKAYERSDAVSGLRAEIRKAKALEWLLRDVEIVDTEGAPIDRDLLLPEDESLVVPKRVTSWDTTMTTLGTIMTTAGTITAGTTMTTPGTSTVRTTPARTRRPSPQPDAENR